MIDYFKGHKKKKVIDLKSRTKLTSPKKISPTTKMMNNKAKNS